MPKSSDLRLLETRLTQLGLLPVSGGGHTIQDEGVDLTARTYLDFVGSTVTVTDDAGNDTTIVTLTASPWSEQIWVAANTATSSAYATSGVEYVPLVQGAGDSISFEVAVGFTGTLEIQPIYGMSAAHTGDVELRLDSLVLSEDDDPDAALSAGSAFAITPGNDANVHTASGETDLQLAVTAGDVVRCVLTRPSGGADTHTADMRLIAVRAVEL